MGAIFVFSFVICISLVFWWINWRDEKREKSAKKQV